MSKIKLFRTSTIPLSLNVLLRGQLKFLNEHFEVTAISGSGADLDEVAFREGVKVHAISMERSISPIKDLQSLIQLYIYFRKERPHIVHSITPKAGLLTMLAGKFAGVPVRIHTFTGLIFPSKEGFLQRLLIMMDKLLCWAATSVFPEGNGVKEDLIKYNITKKPLRVIGNGNVNGVDFEYFDPTIINLESQTALKQNLGINDGDFVFIFVGRLVKDKGINELVAAFSKIENNKCKLLLVGPYETDLDPLEQITIDAINNNFNIISVGYQDDVRPYFAVSNCLVFPSYREGFPNVVLQAGAMCLPSIVTNINGSNEIIKDGENGIVVPIREVDALYNAMLLILQNENASKELGLKAYSVVRAKFDRKIVHQAILQSYLDTI